MTRGPPRPLPYWPGGCWTAAARTVSPLLAVRGAEVRPLTGREQHVARLAADGLTSQEIAARLVLSVRTVDNHLQRAYAKLGVTSRGELARMHAVVVVGLVVVGVVAVTAPAGAMPVPPSGGRRTPPRGATTRLRATTTGLRGATAGLRPG